MFELSRGHARKLLLLVGAIAGLAVPSAAHATIASVFAGKITCETKISGAEAGQRWCGAKANTTVPSFDGTPIDTTVSFPVATGSDNNYPVVGIYHGYAGTKILPSNTSVGVSPQVWLRKGYAVFSITDRGWGASCGKPSSPPNTIKPAPCEHGYIRLMSRAWEVHDAQYLLGLLADEGLINPQAIGSTGQSYGGGMSLQLGALKDRVELANHELIPWTSPAGKPMKIAAAAPQSGWTDLSQAEWPNGSELDYVADSPYAGVSGDHRWGMEKQVYQEPQYNATIALGYLGPNSDPEANLTGLHEVTVGGGPFDESEVVKEQEHQNEYRGAYYLGLSEPPAPEVIQNGWNDDLFPVDQTITYYNKVRAAYPNAAIKLFYPDLGHNPRSGSSTISSTAGEGLREALFAYYLKGEGSEPADIHGGVTVITSGCPVTTGGKEFKAANWASLAHGEVHYSSEPEQTIQAPGTAPASAFTAEGTNVCSTQPAADNSSTAEYKLPAAPAGGYTVMGATSVIAELSTPGANGQVLARLYDENVAAGTEQLIGRQSYRPLNPGGGFTKQIFQLHPQGWQVAAGHVLKLELLTRDSPYMRNPSDAENVQVRNLELRVPTLDGPGSAAGMVQAPLPQYLPAGYTLARNVVPAAPTAPQLSSGSSPNGDGRFTLSWQPTQAAASPSYTLQQKSASGSWSTVASGLTGTEYSFSAGSPEEEGTWKYRVTETNESAESEPSVESAAVVVDEGKPNPPSAQASRAPEYSGGGGWFRDSAEVVFAGAGDPTLSDGSPGSGVNPATIPAAQSFGASGSHTACGTVFDNVGNESEPGCATVQVDATPPSVEVTCPTTAAVGSSAHATITAADGQSGLASDPSGSAPIDTSKTGQVTTTRTAADNVGHETTSSCTTEVVNTTVISTTVKRKLVVKSGEAVELTSTAQVKKVEIQAGGSLDVEGANVGAVAATGANVIRICGGHVGAVKLKGGSGPVTVGDGAGCEGASLSSGTLSGNSGGLTVVGDTFSASLKVTGNSGGVDVTHNTIAKNLTVTSNTGTVTDQPNTVGGKSKAQALSARTRNR